MINGCNGGKFQTAYGNPPTSQNNSDQNGKSRRSRKYKAKPKPPSCDKNLRMHKGLADFMNENFEGCVKKAGDNALGPNSNFALISASESNKVYHHGTIGDARHQSTGSWHNNGLAIDITGIEVGGQLMRYADAQKDSQTKQFYIHFRRCWSDAIKAHSNCREKGDESGSVGNEHRKHKNHLHLSLPCPVYDRKATYRAEFFFWNLLLPQAFAETSYTSDENWRMSE